MQFDREFYGALADVVFGNPFTGQRDALIAKLAPGAPPSALGKDRDALARIVERRLEGVRRDGAPLLRGLNGEERRLAVPAVLYVIYHRYVSKMDTLIERQARSGPALPVPFADEVVADLVRHGFSE